MRLTPTTELEYRCNELQKYMVSDALDAVIIVQNADLFYFTGTVQSGNLYVPASGQPIFMVRKDAGRARMESGLRSVVPFGSTKDIPAILEEYGYAAPGRIGLELDVLPVNFFERFRSIYPNAAFVDAPNSHKVFLPWVIISPVLVVVAGSTPKAPKSASFWSLTIV